MKNKTKGNIIAAVCLFFSLVGLFVLLYTKPAQPDSIYWIKLGIFGIASLVFFLCLSFMWKVADTKVLPSSMAKPIIIFILSSIWIIMVIVFIRSVLQKSFGVGFLIALVLVGITNVIRDMIKVDSKKMRSLGAGAPKQEIVKD